MHVNIMYCIFILDSFIPVGFQKNATDFMDQDLDISKLVILQYGIGGGSGCCITRSITVRVILMKNNYTLCC